MSISDLYRVLDRPIYVKICECDQEKSYFIDDIPLRYMDKPIQSMNVYIDDTYGLTAVIRL